MNVKVVTYTCGHTDMMGENVGAPPTCPICFNGRYKEQKLRKARPSEEQALNGMGEWDGKPTGSWK